MRKRILTVCYGALSERIGQSLSEKPVTQLDINNAVQREGVKYESKRYLLCR